MLNIKNYFFIFLLFISIESFASKNPFDKGVGFKEGVIHYTISGSEYGSKTVYIKDFGKRSVIYINTKSKFMRKFSKTDRVTHITPKWIYEINLESNTTTKLPNLEYLLFKQFQTLDIKKQKRLLANLKTLKNRSLSNLKGSIKLKAQEIIGKFCNLEPISGVATYTAQNSDLILKEETQIFGFSSKTVATDIEKKPLDLKIFILPKNLQIMPTPIKEQLLHQKAQKIINYLTSSQITLNLAANDKTETIQKEDLQNIIQESIKVLDSL